MRTVAGTVTIALAHSLWQGALSAAVLAMVLRILRHSSAHARYTASCLGLFVMVVWPVLSVMPLRYVNDLRAVADSSPTVSAPFAAETEVALSTSAFGF